MKPDTLIEFEEKLTAQERKLLDKMRSPADIQAFLDGIPYSAGEVNRSPVQVLREGQAHCLDGGLFAAAILRRQGHPPLILDIQPVPGQDDDHVLALFKYNSCWGAVAQSNYTGLRFREAIHRTLRELVVSYFEDFFNIYAQKTLREYSRPILLKRFDRLGWMWSAQGVDAIEKFLKDVYRIPLISREQADRLSAVEKLSFQAGRIGINAEGEYKPKVVYTARKS